ncbi:unnamed protein product [Anisakis simplex]|uniref:Zinc finger protein-like 1 homolog n=1 Tax=Anisakis simplex TaxID=6269 RepID=A0A3P6QVQ8_ANISI|nr:unnamed protein product [Anisakis simplex]
MEMGLCKCPKKKVTNLFCFEHRVNVCDYCLVHSHPKCVVQSYLSWLADSDYDTNCSLCATPLANHETIRLQCLHLFHWQCLDAWARRFPSNTAPAGYKCHLCQEAIFPAANQTSPIIEELRTILQRSNWARTALGLTLVGLLITSSIEIRNEKLVSGNDRTNKQILCKIIILVEKDGRTSNQEFLTANNPSANQSQQQKQHYQQSAVSASQRNNPPSRSETPDTHLNVEDVYEGQQHHYRDERQSHFTARKVMGPGDDSTDTTQLLATSRERGRDEDLAENKYKRRSATEWLSRWLSVCRSRYSHGSGYQPETGRFRRKRLCFILFIVLVALLTAFTLLTRLVGGPADDDPAFDPLANPNIRVAAVQESNLN